MPDFAEWLDEKLSERDWNDARLAREAGFNQSVLTKGRGGTGPGVEACIAIASALKVPPGEVLVAAGHIPQPHNWEPKLEEALALFAGMVPDEQDDLLAYMRRRVERGERDKKQNP